MGERPGPEPAEGFFGDALGETVDQDVAVVADEHGVGRDVAVQPAAYVQVPERAQDLAGDLGGPERGQRLTREKG